MDKITFWEYINQEWFSKPISKTYHPTLSLAPRLLRARSRSWDLKISRVFLSPPRRNGTKIVRDAGAVSAQRKILKSWKRHFPSCLFQRSWSGFHILTRLTRKFEPFLSHDIYIELALCFGTRWILSEKLLPNFGISHLFLGLAFILFLFLFCFRQKVFFLIYSLLPFKGNQSIFTIIIRGAN